MECQTITRTALRGIHIAARLRPGMAPSVFVRKIKSNSSKWINENRFLDSKFAWQVGGGSFSIGEKDVPRLVNYIKQQNKHHRKESFEEEYIDLLTQNQIEIQSDYLPEFFNELNI